MNSLKANYYVALRHWQYFKDTPKTFSFVTTYNFFHSEHPTTANDTTLLGVIEAEHPIVISSLQCEVKYYDLSFTSGCHFFYLH